MNPDQPQPVAPNPQPEPPTPQSPANVPTSTPAPAAMGGGKKLSKNAVIGIVVAVIVLAGAIAYGVYAYISNTPDSLMQSAVDNLKDKKSLAASYKIVSGTEQNGVTFSGDVAVTTDPGNGKNGEVIVGLGTGDKRVAINALSLDSTLYLKATNAENLGSLMAAFTSDSASLSSPEFAAALKNLNGQWFELKPSDVQSIAQSSGNDNVSGAVSPQDIKKVLDIYHQYPFIKANKLYADQVVDSANSAHFSLKNDVNTEVAFLQAVKAANLSTIKVTDEDIAKAKTESSTPTDGTVEVWVARDSRQLKQLKVTNTDSAFTLTLMNNVPTFDAFKKPSSTKPIAQLLTTLLGPSINMDELNAMEQSDSSSLLQ
jgi:hypothetical protein